jgi:hypothetical protein
MQLGSTHAQCHITSVLNSRPRSLLVGTLDSSDIVSVPLQVDRLFRAHRLQHEVNFLYKYVHRKHHEVHLPSVVMTGTLRRGVCAVDPRYTRGVPRTAFSVLRAWVHQKATIAKT